MKEAKKIEESNIFLQECATEIVGLQYICYITTK